MERPEFLRRPPQQNNRAAQELLFDHRTMHTLPPTRGLLWKRSILLQYVEIGGVHDVVFGGAAVGYLGCVCGCYYWGQAEEGVGVEGAGFYVVVGRGGAVCLYGYCGMFSRSEAVVGFTNMLQAYLFDNDDRFFVGWKLDKSWILCTVSWSIAVLSAAFISLSAFIFPSEGGYELIPSERYGR